MTIPTRKELVDGSYRDRLAMPSDLAWGKAEIERSLSHLLQSRPAGVVWVFGYGSLIWHPLISFDEERTATLDGWHRSFCVRSIRARGSRDHPGRVLALEAGGHVTGVAFRLRDDEVEAELRLLWTREMVSGVYHPLWVTVALDDGRIANAITFVANAAQPLYEPDASVSMVAGIAARATGRFGSNARYILALHEALARMAIRDDYVEAIVGAMANSPHGNPCEG
jgi:cation transport protein ChaC